MKIISLLLAIYVVMLSAKPCCADTDCQANITGKKELTRNIPAKEKECTGCSPFFTCGSCVGFIISKRIIICSPEIATTPTSHFTVYQQPYIKKIALTIWLPPKIS